MRAWKLMRAYMAVTLLLESQVRPNHVEQDTWGLHPVAFAGSKPKYTSDRNPTANESHFVEPEALYGRTIRPLA